MGVYPQAPFSVEKAMGVYPRASFSVGKLWGFTHALLFQWGSRGALYEVSIFSGALNVCIGVLFKFVFLAKDYPTGKRFGGSGGI